MGVKVKKMKTTTPMLTLGVVSGLSNHLPRFRTNTFADHERIAGILKTLATTQEVRQKIITDFFTEHKLAETESISADHPLGRELFPLLANTETGVSKSDVAVFTGKELTEAITGFNLNFADFDFLRFWLLKA